MMNNTTASEANLDTITKLLAKAESTTNPHEAEAFTAKAMELMQRWMVDEAMLESHRGIKTDTVIKFVIDITGTYHHGFERLASAVGRGFGFKVITLGGTHSKWDKTGVHERICWVGFESDITKAKLLYGSLLVQMAAAQKTFIAEHPRFKSFTGMDKYKTRRSFMFGFADTVGSRLQQSRRQAESQAQDAEPGVGLVLRSKHNAIAEQTGVFFPRLRSGRGFTGHNMAGGYAGGTAAGARAGLATTSIGGAPKGIGR